ncbi:O-antigen ligase family protein [Flavobacterium sp. LHD-85]|uniref:O-antigen ligase family protein n=1 Tax=Flavobacterium sp. LHD-85 TaxID=3071410 RepID=UPI0027E1C317|nr:O-antigen ligase family protein [Flavobacterium sp. LHD-85]MDQ6527681.1 O-antigen ligase family protein [Flavobacterium sp. LHD-85]
MNKFKKELIFLNTLKQILVVLTVAFILVLPQINIQKYVFPTVTSKLIYFLYGSIILFGVFILIIVFSKVKFISFSKIDMVLFILIFYITMNRYFIQSCYGFSIRYIELLGLSFFYLVLRHVSLKDYPWLLLSIIISGISQAVYGNLQLLGVYSSNHSGFKMTGSFFNPGPYAGFLVSVWVVALAMYLYRDQITAQVQTQIKIKAQFFSEFTKYIFEYIPLLGIVFISLVLPALQSRASWIAVLICSGILLEIKYHFLKKVFIKVTQIFQKTALILLFIGILSTTFFNLYRYKKDSSDGRAFIWKVTTEIIADSPLFGVGFDQFSAHYMNYQADYFSKNRNTIEILVADNTHYVFNEWLQFVAENGIIGFLILMIATFVLIKIKIKKNNKVIVFVGKTGFLAIGVFACFSYPMQILPIKLILIFFLAMLSNSAIEVFQFEIEDILNEQWVGKISILLLSFVAIFQIFFYTSNLQRGFVVWNNALNNYQYSDYKGAIKEFEFVYPIFKKNGDFLMNYGKTLSMAGKSREAITVLEKAKLYQNNTIIATALGDSYKATLQFDKAEESYQQAINMAPNKFYATYLLVKLYDVSGNVNKAVTTAKKLLNKDIKIPSTAINEIQEEMKRILKKYNKSTNHIN